MRRIKEIAAGPQYRAAMARHPITAMTAQAKKKLAAFGLTVAMTGGTAAPSQARTWEQAADGGVYVALHFGANDSPRFGVGMEGRGVYIDDTFICDNHSQAFVGAVARIEFMGGREVRFTLGPVLGTTTGLVGYAVDVGAGIALRGRPGFFLQAQIEADFAVLNTRLAYNLGRDGALGLGFQLPTLSQSGFCVTGRPLRRDGAMSPVEGAAIIASHRIPMTGNGKNSRGSGAPSQPNDDGDASLAGRAWIQRACQEWASVPSFCELAQQLETSDATAALVRQAREAAADELRHTALSTELARTFGGLHHSRQRRAGTVTG